LASTFPKWKLNCAGKSWLVPKHLPQNGTLPSRNHHCTQPKTNRTKDTIPKIKPTTITEPQVSNLAFNA
jgi:hypothetical protein